MEHRYARAMTTFTAEEVNRITESFGAIESLKTQVAMLQQQLQATLLENQSLRGYQQQAGAPYVPKEKLGMTARRAFNNLPKYSGKIAEVDAWRFQMEAFLSEEEKYVSLLEHVDLMVEQLKSDDIDGLAYKLGIDVDEVKWLNHQLYQVLSLNLTGEALTQLKNMSDCKATRGINSYFKIIHEYQGYSHQRLLGLNARIFNPPKVKKYSEVTASLELWELRVKEYEKHTGHKMLPIQKIGGITNIAPIELEKAIQLQCNVLNTYERVKDFVMQQVNSRKDTWFGDKITGGGPAPMELDKINEKYEKSEWYKYDKNNEKAEWECETCYEQNEEEGSGELNALKGGKGSGKGSFQGYCNGCGRWGHMKRDCWGSKGKGKGKGDKGGDKGKGGGKPWGKGHPQAQWGKSNEKGWGGKSNWNSDGKGPGAVYWFDQAPPQQQPSQYMQFSADWGGKPLWPLMHLASEPPGLPVTNRFSALQTDDDHDGEIPLCELEANYPDDDSSKNELITVVHGIEKKKNEQKKKIAKNIKDKQRDLMPLFADHMAKDLNNVTEAKWLRTDPETGWRRITSVVDSGASDSVAPLSLCPEVPVRESPGSRRGQTYSGAGAGGRPMVNEGEKEIAMVTKEGVETSATWQMVDVHRPLSAVRRMCKQGNRVIFGLYGGVVQNIATGAEIPFEVEDEIYTMELWMPPVNAAKSSPFPRQAA